MVRNELMAGLNPAYGYPEKFHPQAAEFFMNYTLEKELGCPNEKISNLLPPKDRICRFCSLKYPSVTFRKDAHIYSEFLGNKYLLSDFECDNCNLRFGTYEDHFSKFLGIARTMLSVKGKEKIPKFKSPGGKVVIESDLGEGNQTIIHAKRAITSDETFVFDAETKTTKINFTKHPYIPVKAYKALLKMALSCIDEKELWAYKMAFEYLKNGKHDKEWIGMAHVYRYAMPYTFCYLKPCGFLYRKRNPFNPAYTHVFVLNALNSIYQFVVPFHASDLQYANKKPGLILPWAPPLFGSPYPFSINTIRQMQLDFSSADTVRNDKESLTFSGSDDSYEIARIIDKRTGQIREEAFDGSKIIGIDFLRQPYDPKDHGPTDPSTLS